MDVAAPGRAIFSLNPDWFRLDPPGIEEFESGICTRWYGNGGWAGTTAFAAFGSWSLTDSPAGNYANDTTPWAAMTNGVDLTGQRGCRINYAIRGKVLDGDYFVTGMLDHHGAGHTTLAESVDTHGEFETWSDGIAALDGDPDVHGVFQLVTDAQRHGRRCVRRRPPLHLPRLGLRRGQLLLQRGHVDGHAARGRRGRAGAVRGARRDGGQVAQAIREGAVPLPSLAGEDRDRRAGRRARRDRGRAPARRAAAVLAPAGDPRRSGRARR